MRAVAIVLPLAVLGACSKDASAPAAGSAAAGSATPPGSAAAEGSAAAAGPRDAVLAAWKQGGLDVSAFAPVSSSVGADCASGTVARLDVLLCAFPSADDAKRAADAGLTWVGATTGAAQPRGTLLISVADRHTADPNGRTINQIFKLAPR